jgi:hypothetical protein
MGLGVLSYIYFPDFPDQNTFLSKVQTKFVLKRIEDDRGDSIPDEITWKTVSKHLIDWKIWVCGTLNVVDTKPYLI